MVMKNVSNFKAKVSELPRVDGNQDKCPNNDNTIMDDS